MFSGTFCPRYLSKGYSFCNMIRLVVVFQTCLSKNFAFFSMTIMDLQMMFCYHVVAFEVGYVSICRSGYYLNQSYWGNQSQNHPVVITQ